MITVKKKHICIEIDGKDVETLSDICEIARRYLHDNKDNSKGCALNLGEYAATPTANRDIISFITKIFEL